MTKVSIIVYNRNRKEQLNRTLQGLAKQEGVGAHFLLEVIVIDNASTDGSVVWLRDAAQREESGLPKDIVFLCSDEVLNKAEAIRTAVEASDGEYLAFAESSTIWTSNKLSCQYGMLTENGGDCIYCGTKVCSDKGEEYVPPTDWPLFKKVGHIFPDLLLEESVMINSLFLSREAYEAVGGVDGGLYGLGEYEFLLRLAKQYPFQQIPQVMAAYWQEEEDPTDKLTTQCYILGEFSEELGRLGLKREKFLSVVKQAEESCGVSVVKKYMEILSEDAEYRNLWQEYLEKKRPRRKITLSAIGNVSDVPRCVGCGGCETACPVGAISMEYDEEGFLRPVVLKEKCISCGKCLTVCPAQVDVEGTLNPQICYAMMAEDVFRTKSSSGGIFPLLAKQIISDGGYVAGAVYGKDFHVQHIISNRLEDVERMRSSKYVQSDTRGIYKQVESLLSEGKKVLFSGCACQVAGLKTYLKKEYEQLYTLDVVCHGVPSPGVYENYLKNFRNRVGEIAEVNFRHKPSFGWKTGLYLRFADGRQYAESGRDIFRFGFLYNWFLRDSCYRCDFKGKKYSDITLGDFWGIDRLSQELNDGKGTSFVTFNSLKSMELYRLMEDEICKKQSFPINMAVEGNPCILETPDKTVFREFLFQELRKVPLHQAVEQVFGKLCFDVGMVLWWSPNYGNALTNYALYKTVSKTRNVLAIDSGLLRAPGRFGEFAERNYQLSSQYFPGFGVDVVQNCCTSLMVGSDQTWNIYFAEQFGLGKYYQLDFADDKRRKIAYAASFGMVEAAPPAEGYAQIYQRFDSISVREEFGVEVCRQRYGVEAETVLDPVFLLGQEDYEVLIEQAKVHEEEPFICVYLLNPTAEKRAVCKKLQEMLGGIKMIQMSDNSPSHRDLYRHILEFENVQGDLEVEDWLYFMNRCQYVITDSFHGTCFATIFGKPFTAFVNRQPGRFQVFQKFTGLAERILTQTENVPYDILLEPPDYVTIQKELDQERERSLKWLNRALD